MGVKIKIENDLKKDFDAYMKKKQKEIRKAIDDLINRTMSDAKLDAPNFVSIRKDVKDLTGTVEADTNFGDDNLAAYFEFGTGLSAKEILADYPQWVKDIAMTYYINGNGTLIGKPYLFNNFLKHHITFEKEIRNILKKS